MRRPGSANFPTTISTGWSRGMLHSYAGRCAVIELTFDHNKWRLRCAVGWWGDGVLRGAQLRRPAPGGGRKSSQRRSASNLSLASPVLGEPASSPCRGLERCCDLVLQRYPSATETTVCRGFTDQAPTTDQRSARARNRGKPPDGSEGFTEANVNTTVYAHVECRAQSRQVDP